MKNVKFKFLAVLALGILSSKTVHGSAAPMNDEEINLGLLGQPIAAAGFSLRQKLEKDAADAKAQKEAVVPMHKENEPLAVDIKSDSEANLAAFAAIAQNKKPVENELAVTLVSATKAVVPTLTSLIFGLNCLPKELFDGPILDYMCWKRLLCMEWARNNFSQQAWNLEPCEKSFFMHPSCDGQRVIYFEGYIKDEKSIDEFRVLDIKTMQELACKSVADELDDDGDYINGFELFPAANSIAYTREEVVLRNDKNLEIARALTIPDNVRVVQGMSFDSKGKKVLLKSDVFLLFSVIDNTLEEQARFDTDINDACFMPDDKTILLCNNDKTLHFFDIESDDFAEQINLAVDTDLLRILAVSPDGAKAILQGSPVEELPIFVIDLKTGNILFRLPYSPEAQFSPDGTTILAKIGFEEPKVSVYDARNGFQINSFECSVQQYDASDLLSFSFARDGNTILLGKDSGIEILSLNASNKLTMNQRLLVQMLEDNRNAGEPNDLSSIAKKQGVTERALFEAFDVFTENEKRALIGCYQLKIDPWILCDRLIESIDAVMQSNIKNIRTDRVIKLAALMHAVGHQDAVVFGMLNTKINDHLDKISQTTGMNESADRELHRKKRLLRAAINKGFAK